MGEICIWDTITSSCTLLGTLGTPRRRIRTESVCMAWLQDGTLVVYVHDSQRVFCWSVATYNRGPDTVPSKEHAAPPDATYSLTDRGLVQLANYYQPTETKPQYYEAVTVLFSPDGSQLVLRFFNGTILMWDMELGTLSPPREMCFPMDLSMRTTFAVSDMARKFLIIAGPRSKSPTCAMYDRVDSDAPATSHSRITCLDAFDGPVSRAWFSPCGRLVATRMVRTIDVVHVWRGDDGMRLPVASFTAYGHILQASFTQDSQTLVYGDGHGIVYLRAIEDMYKMVEATTVVYRCL
ncbi:WD40-repeat-containing domain protein [Fomes fomentarius]|nr:WD40-repeat-containing domain protein [Fomes fomentarius]